ncbi:MAG: serine/threonine protein kinase [Glaciecola sp.]
MLTNIGKYKVNGLIAQGATSKVYLAQDPNLSIQLAIKVFDCQLVDNESSGAKSPQQKAQHNQANFINESKILHQLSSSAHVVSFMEFDFTDAKQPYIVMPYYKRSLADLLGVQNKLSMNKTLIIAQQILTGLSYIHNAGLVHLDIKPANILLDDNDQVKIADFGISVSDSMPEAKTPNITIKSGIGSLYYASPEQLIDAQNSTAKSDIYAVSALMYRCLTGVHYSEKKQPVNIVNPKIDAEVSHVIELGLSTEPEQRPLSAKHMAATITDLLKRLDGQINGYTQNDDPEATRVWKNHATDTNKIEALRLSIQNTLLEDGEINEFHFNRLALLAKAELHQQYSAEWLEQYIAQIQSQLARKNNKAAAFFLWVEQVNEAIQYSVLNQDGSLIANAKENLIALGKATLNKPAQELDRIIEHKRLAQNSKNTSPHQVGKRKPRGRFLSAVFIIFCGLILPWWLQSDKTSGSLSGNSELTAIDKNTEEQPQLLIGVTTYDARLRSEREANVVNEISEIQIENSTGLDITIGNTEVILQIHPKDAVVVMQSMQGIPVSNDNIKQGEYWLRVSKNGYQTVTKKIDITTSTYTVVERLELSDTRYFIGNTEKTVADGIPVEFILLPKISKTLELSSTPVAYPRIRIMSFEVTNQLYAACVDAGKCATSKIVSTDARYRTFYLPDYPIINVSWFDVNEQFIPWLSDKTGTRLRLPTRAEWEFAASGSAQNVSKIFSWGPTMQINKAHCKNCNVGDGNSINTTMPVRSFAPNNWQLFDMHGNVQEWTSTCPKPAISKTSYSALQPRCDLAVVKGGSWLNDKSELAILTNDFLKKTVRSHTTGFRLVEEVNE